MKSDTSFWKAMNRLIITNSIIINRPKGSLHPRYPEIIYPLDYGYLENTTASDGSGIDVWIGSIKIENYFESDELLTGILCTFDTLKTDAEIMFLIGCPKADVDMIQNFHNEMLTLFIPNPMANL